MAGNNMLKAERDKFNPKMVKLVEFDTGLFPKIRIKISGGPVQIF